MNELKLPLPDFAETIKALKDAEKGRLLSAMLAYAGTGAAPELCGNELYTWGAVKAMVDKQLCTYQNKVAGAQKARAKKLIAVDIKTDQVDIKKINVERESTPPAPPLKEKSPSLKENNNYIHTEPKKDPLLPLCDEVIDYLNEVTGSHYKHSDSSRRPIHARLSDGFSVEDCKQVILNRWKHWQGTNMQEYMRPDTLFRPSKFEAYLNAPGPRRAASEKNTLLNYSEGTGGPIKSISLPLDEL